MAPGSFAALRRPRQAIDDAREALDRSLQGLADLDRSPDGRQDGDHLVRLRDDLAGALVDEAGLLEHLRADLVEGVAERDELGAALVDPARPG